jgi:transposase-like protein
MVPKDCNGQSPERVVDRYQRSEKAFVLALMQLYVEGISKRKVTAIT